MKPEESLKKRISLQKPNARLAIRLRIIWTTIRSYYDKLVRYSNGFEFFVDFVAYS